jgi:predicted component of type VI protein secretion system
LSFIAQKEQAEREQDWEREQQEKREALEAAQRELDEVLNNKSAEIIFHNKLSEHESQGSSVSIVSDYGLDDRGSIPDRGRGFFH